MMMKKIHKTDTMPDVHGAIEAVKMKDQTMIRACNRVGDPIRVKKVGLEEYHIVQYSGE